MDDNYYNIGEEYYKNLRENTKSFVTSKSNTFWIVIGIVFVVIIVIWLIKYFANRKLWNTNIKCSKCLHRFPNTITNILGAPVLNSSLFPSPSSGTNCTFSMWIYIADW